MAFDGAKEPKLYIGISSPEEKTWKCPNCNGLIERGVPHKCHTDFPPGNPEE